MAPSISLPWLTELMLSLTKDVVMLTQPPV